MRAREAEPYVGAVLKSELENNGEVEFDLFDERIVEIPMSGKTEGMRFCSRCIFHVGPDVSW